MPGFNRTGPLGEGPRTGRGLGRCVNTKTRRSSNFVPGRRVRLGDGQAAGRGPGRGGGRGLSRGFGLSYGDWRPGAVDAKPRLAELQQEANDLRAYLKDLEARIGELEKSSG